MVNHLLYIVHEQHTKYYTLLNTVLQQENQVGDCGGQKSCNQSAVHLGKFSWMELIFVILLLREVVKVSRVVKVLSPL